MIEVEFRNVTITIGNVETAKQGYDRLCEMLASQNVRVESVEWTTDTYTTFNEDGETTPERDTSELFPSGPDGPVPCEFCGVGQSDEESLRRHLDDKHNADADGGD